MASDECNVRNIANVVKTISILRQLENSLNTLALAQADAIIDIATGVHTLELYNNESGFYGHLGGLRKTTDKNETVLHNLDKSIRRLATFVTVEQRYEDLRKDIGKIVGAGYQILRILKDGDAPGATRVYAGTTVVVLNEARADAYTMMSKLERPISIAGFRCR
ncbi:MAG: hypothetical protein ACR2OJ_03835 [Hyphomicrobiales bacterium]